MKAPEELLDKWADLRSKGDYQKIADSYESRTGNAITLQGVRNAFHVNTFNDELFETVCDFYQSKIDLIKQYI